MEPLDQQGLPAQMVPQGLLVFLVHQARDSQGKQDFQDQMVLMVLRDLLAIQDQVDLLVLQDHLDHQAPTDHRVLQGQQGDQDRTDYQETMVLMEAQDQLDPPDQLDRMEPLPTVNPEFKDLRGVRVQQAPLDPQDPRVSPVFPG